MQRRTITPEEFTQDELIFWLAHGVNFLLSDRTNGVWNPLLDSIYEGSLPSPEGIAKAIIAKYGETDWSLEAKAALAWSVQSRDVVFVYKTECLRRLKAAGVADPEKASRAPHNEVVWDVFDGLKTAMLENKAV